MWWLGALACGGALATDKFLDPERAFRIDARFASSEQIEVRFGVEPGYYLYREPFRFSATGAVLGEPAFPRGEIRFDENFGKRVETFTGTLRIALPVSRLDGEAVTLVVVSQGCAEAGLCYPPMTSTLHLSAGQASLERQQGVAGLGAASAPAADRSPTIGLKGLAALALLGLAVAGLALRALARRAAAPPSAGPNDPPR